MGEVIAGDFTLGLSSAAEAWQRGVLPDQVRNERRGHELPFDWMRCTDGRVCRSRQLSAAERAKRDHRIKLFLQCGMPQNRICEIMGVSKGVVYRVASKTSHRRKRHKLSQRAWRDRLPTNATG